MTTTSQASREGWTRFVAVLRAELQTDREEWGDVDDNLLGRYVAAAGSPEERRDIEAAIERHVNLRETAELARAALAKTVFGEGPTPHTSTQVASSGISIHDARSLVISGAPRGWFRYATVPLAAGILIAALGVYWAGRAGSNHRGEVLVASLEIDYGDTRGSEKSDFRLVIQSQRDGEATIVRLTSDKLQVFPASAQPPVPIPANQPHRYGPLLFAKQPITFLVIVTERSAVEIVRETVRDRGVTPAQISDLKKEIEASLWRAGHRWAAINQITVEPLAGE